MSYMITPTDDHRRATWLRIFGTEMLPVFAARPRFQFHDARKEEMLAYDLKLSELSEPQRYRFAAWLSKRYGINYSQAHRQVETNLSWPILATGCRVVEFESEQEEETAGERPSLLLFVARLFKGLHDRYRNTKLAIQ